MRKSYYRFQLFGLFRMGLAVLLIPCVLQESVYALAATSSISLNPEFLRQGFTMKEFTSEALSAREVAAYTEPAVPEPASGIRRVGAFALIFGAIGFAAVGLLAQTKPSQPRQPPGGAPIVSAKPGAISRTAGQRLLRRPLTAREAVIRQRVLRFIDDHVTILQREGRIPTDLLGLARDWRDAVAQRLYPINNPPNEGPLSAGVGYTITLADSNGADFEILPAIDFNVFLDLMDLSATNPVAADVLIGIVINEGAKIRDISSNPAYYLRTFALDLVDRQVKGKPGQAGHADWLKELLAHETEIEATGFRPQARKTLYLAIGRRSDL